MGRQAIGLVPYAQEAAALMGSNVRIERINRGWTVIELAARAGCSRHTVAAVERAHAAVAFGHVLNICAALGIQLFVADPVELARLGRTQQQMLRLMPKRVHPILTGCLG